MFNVCPEENKKHNRKSEKKNIKVIDTFSRWFLVKKREDISSGLWS